MRLVWVRRTAAVVAVVVLGITGVEGSGAQTPPPTCPAPDPTPNAAGPIVTFNAPNETEPAQSTAQAMIAGSATQRNGRVNCVLVVLRRPVQGQPQPEEVARRVFLVDGDDPQPFPFEWAPFFPYNDVYSVTGQGVGTIPGFGTFTGPASPPRQFRTEIPPARPTGLKVTVDQAKRQANLTWSKNPESDIVGYVVRRASGDDEFPAEGTLVRDATSYTDDLGPAPAGTYRYRLTAVRRANQQDENAAIESPAAAEGRVTVTGAPTATTTSAPPTTRPRTTATTARPARNRGAPNRVDLRRFSGATSTIPDGALEPEEGAFGDLDFGERRDGRTDMTITELGEPVRGDGDERPSTLLFFAGGLLAFVVLMQLRWLKNEVDRVPLEEVPPEG